MTNPDDVAFPMLLALEPGSQNRGTDGGFEAESSAGLTKREEFAKAAMQGLCSVPEYRYPSHSSIATAAVEQADALIKALNDIKPE